VIFLTVGSTFPFDRLVRAVDDLAGMQRIGQEVVAQIGAGLYEPRHMRFDRFLAKPQYEQRVQEATALIAHAGAGTIELALAYCKPLLVLPRAKRFHEVVNDHQLATARKFEQLGHLLAAYDSDDIAPKLVELATFVPRPRTADRERMARRIGDFIDQMQADRDRPWL
jgi:UDP-N-acetylglucosamine transferase subunit ALG13